MRLTTRVSLASLALIPLCLAAPAGAQTLKNTFSNNAANPIPLTGPAGTYPSTITVAGVPGVTYHVSVRMTLSHTFPSDLDILLVGPGNTRAVVLLSDVGGGADWVNTRIEMDDCAPRAVTNPTTGAAVPAGRYRPSNVGLADPFAAPAPNAPYDGTLATFNNVSPNGTWSLYIVDDAGGDSGQMTNWSLTVYTQPAASSAVQLGLNPISCTGPDYDGDGRTDVAVYRDATAEWFIAQSGSNRSVLPVAWGAPSSYGVNDMPVPADYDGDGVTDVAVYRRATGEWFVRKSFDSTVMAVAFGAPSSFGTDDQPVAGDYDGDGQADLAIYRRTTAEWFIRSSSGAGVESFFFGYPPLGDRPAR